MNSFISVIIGFNIMIAPMPAMETKEVETATHPAMSIEEYIQKQSPILETTGEIQLIPLTGHSVIECQANMDSAEVQSQSIIGDGFETYPCPQNYPGCMVVRWEQSDSQGTTMCHFHKIRHKKE